MFGEVKVVEFYQFNEENSKHLNLPKDYDYENSCMHATLEIFGQTLFLSDNTNTKFPTLETGNMISICLPVDKNFDAKGLYERMLAHECQIIVPFAKQYWGSSYGMVKDKFGICWQINQMA